MKKVLNVGIGGVPFVIEEDAYERLSTYLAHFKNKLTGDPVQGRSDEVMEDLEERVAELFRSYLGSGQVVTMEITEKVISQLGMPDGSSEPNARQNTPDYDVYENVPHKLYRDMDNKSIAGVCSGIAAYFDLDVVLIRVIFSFVILFAGCGLLLYIILWIVAPRADTPAKKCELRGIPATAENMAKFRYNGK